MFFFRGDKEYDAVELRISAKFFLGNIGSVAKLDFETMIKRG